MQDKHKAVVLEAGGIKCDNPACGWSDMGVDFDMEKFHNMPCPQCASNLLTDADYYALKRLHRGVAVINAILWPFMFLKGGNSPQRHQVELTSNGSGKISTSIINKE